MPATAASATAPTRRPADLAVRGAVPAMLTPPPRSARQRYEAAGHRA
ncbi:hypothetical protein VAB18032_09030 [Micromonospora maris AB-18-032]|nr:hypothetical protein VAB18032_09030 [Micromonospora maris AB-18-032]